MTAHVSQHKSKLVPWTQFWVRMTIVSALFPISLFVAAGRLDWTMEWVYVVLAVSITVVSRYLMIRRNPALFEERSQALRRDDTKSWDKIFVSIIVIGPLIQLIVVGLDMRYDWSPPFALWLEVMGLALVAIGFLFATWAMLTNAFYSSGVRIQSDRGQYVITDGPYQIVRHPSYIGLVIGNMGTSLALSSWWSLIPMAFVAVVIVVRTSLEDRALHDELPGYVDYVQQTRYRLVPGVW